jgi:hypothetical protein
VTDLDNQLSVLSIPLPVGPPCRLARLRRLHSYMSRLKASTVPLGMALLTQASGHMPRAVLEFQADYFCSKATGVLTNVPGPTHARTLHGKAIQEVRPIDRPADRSTTTLPIRTVLTTSPSHPTPPQPNQTQFIFFVPAVSSLSMVLSTLTYAGRLSVGLVVDESVPAFKCDDFFAVFLQEFEAYEAHALQAKPPPPAPASPTGKGKAKSA